MKSFGTPIKNRQSVCAFISFCIHDLELLGDFHPDTDFEDYYMGDVPCFSPSECSTLNKQMEYAFEVCCDMDLDIYELSLAEL